MAEDDGQRICPFMSRPIVDITGAGVQVPILHEVRCIEERCRAWHPAVSKPVMIGEKELLGHHVSSGWCFLIPASEPNLRHVSIDEDPDFDPLTLLEGEDEPEACERCLMSYGNAVCMNSQCRFKPKSGVE